MRKEAHKVEALGSKTETKKWKQLTSVLEDDIPTLSRHAYCRYHYVSSLLHTHTHTPLSLNQQRLRLCTTLYGALGTV